MAPMLEKKLQKHPLSSQQQHLLFKHFFLINGQYFFMALILPLLLFFFVFMFFKPLPKLCNYRFDILPTLSVFFGIFETAV